MGGDCAGTTYGSSNNQFQSTPPHGGRPRYSLNVMPSKTFQSTPPHGGRQNLLAADGQPHVVSIHAPAWGATNIGERITRSQNVFQSTPPHGGRPLVQPAPGLWQTFQSTPPHGGRPNCLLCAALLAGVSIHAPAWGATCAGTTCGSSGNLFQSTPPHGGRPAIGATSITVDVVSIHAPAWGATDHVRQTLGVLRRVSIHAPAWGATARLIIVNFTVLFQSTPPHGGRPSTYSDTLAFLRRFNPRPRMGGDGLRL